MPPPTIDRALMQQLAELARLHLGSDKLPMLRARLDRVLAAFSSLGEHVPADAGDPAAPATALPLRADEPEAPLPLDTVLRNAPQRAGGAFVVPRVIDA